MKFGQALVNALTSLGNIPDKHPIGLPAHGPALGPSIQIRFGLNQTPTAKHLAHRIGNMLKSFTWIVFGIMPHSSVKAGLSRIPSVPPPETHPDLSPETAVLELPLWTGYQSALAVP